MKWGTIEEFKDMVFLDSDPDDRGFNIMVEISKEKKCYEVRFYIRDTIDENTKTKTFKTLAPAKKCAEKWFRGKIAEEIKKLKKLL